MLDNALMHFHFSYILIAISEIMASITGLEYSFTKAPKNMRSLVMAVFLFMTAIASAIGEAFVCEYDPALLTHLSKQLSLSLHYFPLFSLALSADPLLVWNYGVMAVLAFVGGALFWLSVRKLDKDEDKLNNLADGHFGTEKEKE